MSDEEGVDLIADDLSLARAQLAGGLAPLAETTLRHRVAEIALERGSRDELDAAHALLAEALWRQGRPRAAGAELRSIRASSLERRRPLVAIIEAEAAQADGDPERATSLAEAVLAAAGIDEVWLQRGGVPGLVPWPVPPSMRPSTRGTSGSVTEPQARNSPERIADAHRRLEAARAAYGIGEVARGDAELSLALRLDPRVAVAGLELLEAGLGREPAADRLLLYGDLLRAAGRGAEASAAFDRAARA
jgi:tetratricopeptide (TPR) repeat protein